MGSTKLGYVSTFGALNQAVPLQSNIFFNYWFSYIFRVDEQMYNTYLHLQECCYQGRT